MIGQTFGNYRVTGLIGEGGMGVVYLAEHPAIGRRAAVKILRPGLTADPELARRFFNEARAANAIRHPGIVEVFDSGTLPSGVSYLVMELLEGESLAARLRNVGRLPAVQAGAIAAQTASALAAAHAAGIVHRDLKPDNLFLVPDDRDSSAEMVKILDFGIAKLGMDAARTGSVRTRTGSVMGTPAYMSPEQCRGTKEVDHRTDIYALGVILFEMVCGRTPFVSEGFGEMVHLHISEPPPAPRSIDPGVPADLERVILRCLAKDPERRFPTMAELHAALTGRSAPAPRAAAPGAARSTGASIPAAPTTFTQAAHARDVDSPTTNRSHRGRWSALAVGAALLGGVVLWQTGTRRAPSGPSSAPTSSVPAPLPPPAAAPKEPATVPASIVSEPTGARVVREADGAVIGMTPFRERWAAGTGVSKLRIELEGYRPEPVIVPLDRGVDLTFMLKKLGAREPQRGTKPPRPTKGTVTKDATPSPTPTTPAKPAARPAEPVPL